MREKQRSEESRVEQFPINALYPEIAYRNPGPLVSGRRQLGGSTAYKEFVVLPSIEITAVETG